MEDVQIAGAAIGAIIGYIISLIKTSPKFTYLGGHWGKFEGGTGCFKGCLINILFIVIGGGIGLLIGTILASAT